MIDSYITPDGIKLYVKADDGPRDSCTVDLVGGIRSDFSLGKYHFHRDFGAWAEYK
jgi:hypothetical protein